LTIHWVCSKNVAIYSYIQALTTLSCVQVTSGHDSKKQQNATKHTANVSRSNDDDDLAAFKSAVKVDVQVMPDKEEDYVEEDVHSIQDSHTSKKALNYDDDEKV
jgi:hypothetical protein